MTPHISAKKEEVADIVIMPGDPKRAKFIAENFLDNPVLVSDVRCAYLYTGNYKNKRVSVMASGMGMPSIGIYSYELFKFYDVKNIIRLGSCKTLKAEIDVSDIIKKLGGGGHSSNAAVQIKDKTIKEVKQDIINLLN